jgi:hypothetical protein
VQASRCCARLIFCVTFETMKPATNKPALAYPLLSYGILLLVAGYGLFTFIMLFVPKTAGRYLPGAAGLYHVFFVQNWHLFASTKMYNRQLNMILLDTATGKTDTIDLVQYSIAQRRIHAPFNQYYDALDHLLFFSMNQLETRLLQKEQAEKKSHPLQTAHYYWEQTCRQVVADLEGQALLHNFYRYGRYVLQKSNSDTLGKSISFEVLHRYISPAQPPPGPATTGNLKKIFAYPLH